MAETPSSTELLAARSAERMAIQQLRLRVIAGPDEGLAFSSKTDRITIGTHPSNGFVLGDATMSRFHCEIVIEAGSVTCKDLGSRNGTVVDGVSVVAAHLRDGSTLQLGKTRIRIELSGNVDVALSERAQFGLLVGRSPAMRALFAALEHAAASTATVLLQGETGTGKDAAAESIHLEGARKEGPFVVVDCGAIPTNLLESELFGFERGAFTGAEAGRMGAIEAAHGGTLFLDEIGEIGVELQPKFLRVLETQQVQRIGSTKRVPVDVRIIAATNRNLRQEVNAKRFRADLYFRLAVLEFTLPPLRERLDDLPLLCQTLLDGMDRGGDAVHGFQTPTFLAELAKHTWPGNVRELRNYLERCLAMRTSVTLDAPRPDPDEPIVDARKPLKEARETWLLHFERQYLRALLETHQGNVTEAAAAAGINRTHLYRLLSRCGIR